MIREVIEIVLGITVEITEETPMVKVIIRDQNCQSKYIYQPFTLMIRDSQKSLNYSSHYLRRKKI
jgi:hypothetical protein